MRPRGLRQLGARRAARGGTLLLIAAWGAACGTSSHAATPTTVPASLSTFEAVVKGSTTGSGVSQLPAGLAESVGKGICAQLGQGETPAQISAQVLASAEGEFPPKAVSELMVDSSQWLCPKYAPEVRRFAQP